MDFGDFKLYNLCIERLRHQIMTAQAKGRMREGRALLESYCTGDVEEIIDILELHDLEDRTAGGLMAKLGELAHDASLFVKERIEFGFDRDGDLCLYWVERQEDPRAGREEEGRHLTHKERIWNNKVRL